MFCVILTLFNQLLSQMMALLQIICQYFCCICLLLTLVTSLLFNIKILSFSYLARHQIDIHKKAGIKRKMYDISSFFPFLIYFIYIVSLFRIIEPQGGGSVCVEKRDITAEERLAYTAPKSQHSRRLYVRLSSLMLHPKPPLLSTPRPPGPPQSGKEGGALTP